MSKHIHIHVGTKDAEGSDELDKFLAKVKSANELLTRASSIIAELSSLKDNGLKNQAYKLEDLIDKARSYAFKIR